MFTYPIGLMNQAFAGVRPTSIVDTPVAGTIVNSGNSFDTDHNNFGVWTLGVAFGTNYSIYSIVTIVTLTGKKLYVTWDTNSTFGQIQVFMSIDGGATYLFQTALIGPAQTGWDSSWSGTPFVPDAVIRTLNIPIPDGVPSNTVKIKTQASSLGITDVVRIYDVFIQ